MKKFNITIPPPYLLSTFFLFGFFCCHAQININYNVPENYQALVAYEVEKSINFSLPDGANLKDLSTSDLIQLKSKKERSQVEKYLLEDGTITTVITHLDSENVYPSWFKPPSVTVIDKNKVYQFDTDGQVTVALEHDPLYRVMYKLAMLNVSPENFGVSQKPTYLSGAEINSLEADGRTVTIETNGMITITRPLTPNELTVSDTEVQIRYHPEKNYVTKLQLISGETKRKSHQFNHYNSDEDYVVEKSVTQSNETTASGFCYEKLVIEDFSKYEIKRKVRGRSQQSNAVRDDNTHKFVEITPNPFNNQLSINLSEKVNFKTEGTLKIINLLGKEVYKTTLNQNTSKHLSISTNNWPSGAYLVNWSINGKTETTKIVK